MKHWQNSQLLEHDESPRLIPESGRTSYLKAVLQHMLQKSLFWNTFSSARGPCISLCSVVLEVSNIWERGVHRGEEEPFESYQVISFVFLFVPAPSVDCCNSIPSNIHFSLHYSFSDFFSWRVMKEHYRGEHWVCCVCMGGKNIFPPLLLEEHTKIRQLLCFFAFLSDSELTDFQLNYFKIIFISF